MSSHSKAKPVSLALQGGGTHSAITWGAIDQLLLDGRLRIESISASSGGALLAAVLAQGLLHGGPEAARELMVQFWRKLSVASSMLPLRMKVVDQFLGHVGFDLNASSLALDMVTRLFSPQQFNLFDINPLRGIVEELVDFQALNAKSPIRLHINATNARTGKSHIFTEKNLTLDAVMASACLPYLFKAVEIDGEAYWDGSFSGCPPLSPLVNEGVSDILLVQVHPATVEEVPTLPADILDRATEISFQAVLQQELKLVELYNRMVGGSTTQHPVTVHTLDTQELLASLGRSSKLNADWDFLVYMHDLGVQAATDWLLANYNKIGSTQGGSASSAA